MLPQIITLSFLDEVKRRPILFSPLNGIYIVYTGLSRGICNNIPPQPRHFFVLGLRPRTKKCLGFGGILLHIPRESTVYTIYIPFRGLNFFMKILSDISPIWGIYCLIYPPFEGYMCIYIYIPRDIYLYISRCCGIYEAQRHGPDHFSGPNPKSGFGPPCSQNYAVFIFL